MEHSHKKDYIFLGAIAAMHILFFMMATFYTRIYMGDSFEYVYEALNIKSNFFFYSGNPAMPIEPEYMTQRQPGYPLFLLAIYLFIANNWIVIIIQNALSIFNIYYCRYILMRLGYKDKYDWLLLLLLFAYPAQFINANTIAPDILLQTITVLYFSGFVFLYQTGEGKYAVFMSMALIDGLMVKPVLYPFVVVHLIIFILLFFRSRLQELKIAAVLPLLAVLLYCGINYTRTGKFHFSSNQAFNAIYYFNGFISKREGPDSASKFLQKERSDLAAIPSYKDRYDHANKRGMQLLRQNFVPYMAYHLENSARIFIEPGKGEMDLFTGRLTYGRLYSNEQTGFYSTLKNKGWGGMADYIKHNPSLPIILLVLLFNIVRLVGMLIFFFSRDFDLHIRLFAFILLGYFAVAAGPIANTRYFLPVSLIAIGCAAIGYKSIWEKRMANR